MRYKQREDGETFVVKPQMKMACCDCGLVHFVHIAKRGNELTMTAWRDNRGTAAKRRSGKYPYRRRG